MSRSSIPDQRWAWQPTQRQPEQLLSQTSARGGALALVLLALAGCATTAAPPGGSGSQPPTALILVLRQEGCCSGGALATAGALVDALPSRAEVRQAEAAASAAALAAPAADPGALLAETLAKAQRAYLNMHMDEARELLDDALERTRQTAAKGLQPKQLALLHLLLVAVSDAQRRADLMQQHSDSAVGFDPELAPDADIFPPPVQEAIDRARQQLERVDVVIRAVPDGAAISWDGLALGQAPVRLPQQPRGKHYLLVEHPLSQPRREEIHLSTAAELKVTLEPAAPERVLAAAAARSELRPLAAQLLGVQTIIYLAGQAEDTLAVECAGPDGAPSRIKLAPNAASFAVQQAAETCLRQASLAGQPSQRASAAGEQAVSQPPRDPAPGPGHFRRYWWAWAAAGAIALSAGIALPLVLSGEDESGRPVRLELPRP